MRALFPIGCFEARYRWCVFALICCSGSTPVEAADGQTELTIDGINFSNSVVLTFTDGTPQFVGARAIDDLLAEGPHTGTITHTITSTGDPVNYPLTLPVGSPFHTLSTYLGCEEGNKCRFWSLVRLENS